MKVTFKQSGGFAGLVKSGIFDTDAMPEEQGQELKTLVERSATSGPGRPAPGSRGADHEQYSIVIETADGSRSIQVDQGSVPEELKPLLRFLRKQSHYEKRS
jgi:Emfourin